MQPVFFAGINPIYMIFDSSFASSASSGDKSIITYKIFYINKL